VAVRLELVDQRSDETHLVERGRAAEHLGARRAWGANAVPAPVAKGAVSVAKGAERL